MDTIARELSSTEIEHLKKLWNLAELKMYVGGYYAASGKVDGHNIEMYISEERMPGCLPGLHSYVRMRIDDTWLGAMDLDGHTRAMADALRREHPGTTRLLSEHEIKYGLDKIRELIRYKDA